jgi:hypothetical protein
LGEGSMIGLCPTKKEQNVVMNFRLWNSIDDYSCALPKLDKTKHVPKILGLQN